VPATNTQVSRARREGDVLFSESLVFAAFLLQALSSAVYAAALWNAWQAHDRRFLVQWMASLAALSVSFASATLASAALGGATSHLVQLVASILSLIAGYAATAYLALGTRSLLTEGFGRRRGARRIVIGMVLIGTVSTVGAVAMPSVALRDLFGATLAALTIGVASGWCGVAVYRSGEPGEQLGRRLLGIAFGLYATKALITTATRLPDVLIALPSGLTGVAAVLDVVVLQVVGLCMLVTVLEFERRRIVHHETRADVAAEEAATASAFLEAAVDSCNDSVHEVDGWLRLTAFNAAFREGVLERSEREPVIGALVTDVLPVSDRSVWRARYERVLAGTPLTFDLPVRDDGGATRVREIRVMPIHRGEAVVGVVCVSRDSTTERRLRDELAVAHARADRMLAHARELVLSLSPDGRIRFAGPSVIATLGWTMADLLGRSVLMLSHSDGTESLRQAMVSAESRSPETVSLLVRLRHRAGGWITLDARLSGTVDATGDATIVVNALDVTDRLSMEAELRRAQREATIGQLVTGVAHEFTNVLTTIIGNTELALLRTPSSLELTDIDVAARRGRSLVAQLQEFGGRTDPEPTVFAVGERLSQVNYLLLRLLGDDTQVATNIEDQDWQIQMGAGQFEQLIINLAIACRDSAPPGSKLAIDLRMRRVPRPLFGISAEVPPGEYVALSIETIRPESTGSPAAPRHGQLPLGMTDAVAIADRIIERAGGVLAAIPGDGPDTAYCAYIPRHREAPIIERRRAARVSTPMGSETILLAEDDPAIRSLTARVLREAGYTVLEAFNGRDAMQTARTYVGTINLVLSDVVMPEMNGTELVRHLRTRREGLRAMLMSGYKRGNVHLEPPGDDRYDFLKKPFTTGELLSRLRQTLDAAS
jgi:PAS domain S-box-containing protein